MIEHRIDLDRVVRATPERVWEVLADIEHSDQTLSGVTRVEMLSQGPYGVGTRWRETRRMYGKEASQEMAVTVADAPRRTVVEAEAAGVRYLAEFTLTPETAGATRLALGFSGVQDQVGPVQKVLWRLFGGLGIRASRKAMAKDLEDIAARAERPS